MSAFPDLAAIVLDARLEELPALAARCREAELLAELRLRRRYSSKLWIGPLRRKAA